MASMHLQHDQSIGPWILLHVVSGPWTSFVAALDKGQCRKAVCRRHTDSSLIISALKPKNCVKLILKNPKYIVYRLKISPTGLIFIFLKVLAVRGSTLQARIDKIAVKVSFLWPSHDRNYDNVKRHKYSGVSS